MIKYNQICYHGTDRQKAQAILKNGFKKWTYFGKHQEDAIGFGGTYIFAVAFVRETLPKGWQFIIRRKVSPKRIVEHYRITVL